MNSSRSSRLRTWKCGALAALFALGSGHAHAAVAQRGTATTATTGQNSTNLTINLPAGVVAGDVMLAVISKNAQTIGATTPPSGWTQVDARNLNTTSANNKTQGSVFYRVADGSEGASFSFGLGGGMSASASNGASGAIVAFSGVDGTGGVHADGSPGGPFDVDPGAITVAGPGNAVSAAEIITATPGSGVVMLGMVGGNLFTWSNWNTTAPGSLTEIAEAPRAGSSVGVAWALTGAAGATGNGTATLSGSVQPHGSILVALKKLQPPGPVINSFTAAPAAITGGGTSVLTWDVSAADSLTIDNGVGAVAGTGSVEVAPAATTTYTLSATNGLGTNTQAITVTVIPPGPYRYYRFAPTALRNTGSANSVQIAEFQMTQGGVRLGGATASNPGGNSPGGESAQQGNDNDLNSKWLDFTKFTPLVLDFGSSTAADGYRLATANDGEERDPVSWRVQASHDGVNWATLDERLNFEVPTARNTYLPDFVVGGGTGPSVTFSGAPTTIFAGETTTLSWTVTGADPGAISIDNGIGVVGPGGSVEVSPATTTTYTLSATGSAVTTTRSVTITVNPPPAPVVTFNALPAGILAGGSSTLSWTVSHATSVSIDNGIGAVAATGTQNVTPAATTTWTLPATGPGGTTTRSATVQIANGGLNGKTFDTIFGDSLLAPISNLQTATPSATFLQIEDISYQDDFHTRLPGITSGDSFSVLWEGWFDVTKDGPGDYSFGTESDDGSMVYLDLNDDGDFSDAGELIVDNNGDHPGQTRTGNVNLTRNSVRIAIGFYENGGGEIMRARFKKGTSVAFSSMDPVNGTSGHFLPSAPSGGPPSVTFGASPAAIFAGGSSSLTWNVTNATTISIDNGIGSVAASGSQNVTPAATTTWTLTAANANGTTTRTATVTIVPEESFRYYRFVPTALRDEPNVNSLQIAEFQMLLGGVRIGGASASNPGGDSPGGEGPQQGNDNDLGSKWLDFTKFTPLVLDFGVPTAADGYRLATANDAEERDPVSWRIEGSADGTNWVVLDTKTNYAMPSARETYTENFTIGTPPPAEPFDILALSLNAAGTEVTLTWDSTAGASYRVRTSTTLAADSWTTAQSGIASQGATTTATVPAGGGPRAFFVVERE